jgi:hypothetical protein
MLLPAQDTVSFVAESSKGTLIPGLQASDILTKQNGIPQTILSLRTPSCAAQNLDKEPFSAFSAVVLLLDSASFLGSLRPSHMPLPNSAADFRVLRRRGSKNAGRSIDRGGGNTEAGRHHGIPQSCSDADRASDDTARL